MEPQGVTRGPLWGTSNSCRGPPWASPLWVQILPLWLRARGRRQIHAPAPAPSSVSSAVAVDGTLLETRRPDHAGTQLSRHPEASRSKHAVSSLLGARSCLNRETVNRRP